jgi:hypothetical protein
VNEDACSNVVLVSLSRFRSQLRDEVYVPNDTFKCEVFDSQSYVWLDENGKLVKTKISTSLLLAQVVITVKI